MLALLPTPIRIATSALLLAAWPSLACAQQLGWQTDIIDLSQANRLSGAAASLAAGGYELSDGTWQSLVAWYTAPIPDVRIDFLTTVTADFGLLWGLSTGERAPKYKIDPSVRIGFIRGLVSFRSASLTISASSNLFGALNEDTCEADYGDLGGVQTVNCRLAASTLSPEDTLKYLVHDEPARYGVVFTLSGTF